MVHTLIMAVLPVVTFILSSLEPKAHLNVSRWVALTESTGSNRFFRRLRDQQRSLLMKLAINATSAEDCFEKKRKVIVYFSSRDPEHIRHITFVQKTAV